MTPLALTVVCFVIAVVSVIAGVVWLALPLFVLALVALVWTIVSFARGTATRPVMHRTRDPELLGPGGADDPDRSR